MKKKVLGILAILFFVILTTSAFAQSSAPSDEGTRPRSGLRYGARHDVQPRPRSAGQGQGAYGPGMMGGQGQGQGQTLTGPA